MPLAFSSFDWLIVIGYMVVATAPGFLCRKYIRGQEDFLVAGRTLSVYLATATLTATETGLVTIMYMAEMGYRSGFSGMTLGLIAMSATLFVGLTGFMVAGLRRSGVTTLAEYYQQRYSRGVRILGGFIIATAGILNYGIFLRVEADFIALITQIPDVQISALSTAGVPLAASAPLFISSIKLVMTIMVLLVLVYTLVGGMVSVVITDYIQFIVMSAGMGVTTWWVVTRSGIGGFEGMVNAVQHLRPEYGWNPFVKNGALGIGLAWVLWQMMHWVATNTWQTGAFRTAATDSPRTAKAMWSLTAFNYFGRAIVPMLWGIGALAFLSQSGANLKEIPSLQAMPLFLSRLPVGLVGLLMAGMLAALMSTHSSYLLAWSGVITEDLVTPIARITGREISAKWRIRLTRFFIICLAAFLLSFGLWFKVKETIWNYLAITGTMYFAGSSALLAMGLYWRRANTGGAYAGLALGALPGIAYIVLRIGALIAEPAMKIAGHIPEGWWARTSERMTDEWTGLISYPLAFTGMIVGSILWERRQRGRQAATTAEPMAIAEGVA
jgi:solute:Na+ symporter, SSS family